MTDETPDLLAALRDSFRRPPATSDDVVSRARAALDGITPGDWATYTSDKGQIAVVSPDEKFFIALLHPDDCDTDMGRANITLIADAPTLVRDLLAENERLRTGKAIEDAFSQVIDAEAEADATQRDLDEARAAVDRVRKVADELVDGPFRAGMRAVLRALDGEA